MYDLKKHWNKLSIHSQNKEIITKSSGTLIVKIGGLLCSYLLGIFLARYFGKTGLGEYAIALSTITLFNILISLGNYPITVKYFALYPINSPILRKYVLTISFLILLGWVVLTGLLKVGKALVEPVLPIQYEKMIILIPIILAFSFFTFIREWLRGLAKPISYSFFLTSAIPFFGLMLLGVNSFLIEFIASPITLLKYSVLFSLASLIIICFSIFIRRASHEAKELHENSPTISVYSLTLTSLPILLSQIITWSLSWVDQWVLSGFFDVGLVGIYFTAVKLSTLIGIPSVAIGAVVAPKIVRAHSSGDISGLNKMIINTSLVSLLIAILMIVFFIFFSDFILGIYGTEFLKGKTSLYILTVGQFINALTAILGHTLEFTGNQKYFLKAVIISGACNLLLNLSLVPLLGVEGAAISTTLSLSLVNLLFLYYVRKIFRIQAIPSWTHFKSLF